MGLFFSDCDVLVSFDAWWQQSIFCVLCGYKRQALLFFVWFITLKKCLHMTHVSLPLVRLGTVSNYMRDSRVISSAYLSR